MTISIMRKTGGTEYAAGELARFLREFTGAEIGEDLPQPDRAVTLGTDSAMPADRYLLDGDGSTLAIRGGSPSALLCGVCDALADGGLLFEATGYAAPRGFDAGAFFAARREVRPKFRLRGVRQHINFTMDISSYPLRDAKEYVRALARMRFNAITFHSYAGQWHAADPADPHSLAGHFFYGQRHPVPADDPLTASRIGNRRIFCIPEAEGIYRDRAAREAIYDDEARRAEFAQYWLNEVIGAAKEAGMAVTLSVEILSDDSTLNARMLQAVCETYRGIDTLELISEECGGFRTQPGVTRENVADFLTGLFGDGILGADGEVPGLPGHLPPQLPASAVCLKRILAALDRRDEWLGGLDNPPALRAGLYVTDADALRVLRPILRAFLPAGVTASLLPAHGSLAAADNVERTGTTGGDWQNTMFYSWAEFDGNMFLQQMSTDGIEKLVSLADAPSNYGFCINHWRMAENALAIAYAAEAAVSGMAARDFYRLYARRKGIADAEGFAEVCRKLALLDTRNRDDLFTIGFCALSCWLSWHRRGDAVTPRGFPAALQEKSVAAYGEAVRDLLALLPSAGTREGIAWLRLMANRCETSILHIRSMMALDEIFGLYDYAHPAPPAPAQAKAIHSALERSRGFAEAYLRLYGEILPDRGGEGQLVSYHETTLAYIDAVAAHFAGKAAPGAQDPVDAPPMPDPEAATKSRAG